MKRVHTEMTFVPRNITILSEDLQEWGPRGKRYVKRAGHRVVRKAAKLDLRKREW